MNTNTARELLNSTKDMIYKTAPNMEPARGCALALGILHYNASTLAPEYGTEVVAEAQHMANGSLLRACLTGQSQHEALLEGVGLTTEQYPFSDWDSYPAYEPVNA